MTEEDVYCTLLLNDRYLPGAQVLAHSLRDGGTSKRLAVMVTLAGVSAETVDELKKLFDYVIPVDPIYCRAPANLYLMNRVDLTAAFTKLHVWKQTQFRRVVFVDADVLALRPPDELFDIDAAFAAAPDIGWPDCFNSGVMVLKPDLGTHAALLDLANRGVSFDGADQGLLNQHFHDWHRISFNYNVTPSASYQYLPAYRHYGSQVSMVHFIGADKPWDRAGPSGTSQPYNELSGKWWDVWNKHHTPNQISTPQNQRPVPSWGESHGVAGEERGAPVTIPLAPAAAQHHDAEPSEIEIWPNTGQQQIQQLQSQATRPATQQVTSASWDAHVGGTKSDDKITCQGRNGRPLTHYEQHLYHGRLPDYVMTADGPVPQMKYFLTGAQTHHIQEYTPSGEPVSGSQLAQKQGWDPLRSSPPTNAAPEAHNFEVPFFANQWDNLGNMGSPFIPPPPEYSQPPPRPIFPWEGKARTTTRVFAEDMPPAPPPPADIPSLPEDDDRTEQGSTHSRSDISDDEEEEQDWRRFTIENQWDTDPVIRDYVVNLKRRQNPESKGSSKGKRSQSSQSAVIPTRDVNPNWFSGSEDEAPSEEWDPYAKLEELNRLPRSFIQAYMSRMMRNQGTQTDSYLARGTAPEYKDSATQTDIRDFALQLEPQYESDWDEGTASVDGSVVRSEQTQDTEDTWETDYDEPRVSFQEMLMRNNERFEQAFLAGRSSYIRGGFSDFNKGVDAEKVVGIVVDPEVAEYGRQ